MCPRVTLMASPNVWPAMAGEANKDSDATFDKLASYLEALANPGRLELLSQLRQPRVVGEIELRPTTPGKSADRNITRQAVRKQLAKLEEAGLVLRQRVRREGVLVEEHVVNHPMLFALVEELRSVTRLPATVALAPAATMTGRQVEEGGRGRSRGARLITVHGSVEGRTFPLESRGLGSDRGWVVGRRRGLAVSLEHDPFVSNEHAEVLLRGARFEVLDLRTNKNGTFLNWEALPRGGSAPLSTGDVIGVGRTLLLFRES